MKKERVEELMLHIGQQVKDVGMILQGRGSKRRID